MTHDAAGAVPTPLRGQRQGLPVPTCSHSRTPSGYLSALACGRDDYVSARPTVDTRTGLQYWTLYPDVSTAWTDLLGRPINVVVRVEF